MVPIGKYYLGATPEGPLSPTPSMAEAVVRAVIGCRHHLPIGALYNKWHSTPCGLLNPYHSRRPSTQAMSIRSQHQLPTRAVHHCATVPSSTKYREHHKTKRHSTTHPYPIQKPSRESTPTSLLSDQGEEGDSPTTRACEKPQRAVNILARCGKTSSWRPRRLGIAVFQTLSRLRKTKMMCLGHLSHHVRLACACSTTTATVDDCDAAKGSIKPTPPPQRVDPPEVVLPDPPTPTSEGKPTPPGGRFIRLEKKGERGRSWRNC